MAVHSKMKRWLLLSPEPVDETALASSREAATDQGAAVIFIGIVRGLEGTQPILGLDYECFHSMAQVQFGLIFDTIEQKWPIQSIRLQHRTGIVEANTPSLWVEVTASHRREAFEACQWLIDEMKVRVPMWKKAIPTKKPRP